MCGIIGVIGSDACSKAFKGIKALEYRGYDSWGLAAPDGSKFYIERHVGKISEAQLGKVPSANFALGHCLHPDTYVQLADGRVCPIKKIADGEELSSLDFGSLKLSPRKSGLMKHESPTELYELRTSANSLVCTAEHKMFVFNGGAIVEKRSSELQIGDLLACVAKVKISGSTQPLRPVQVKRYYKYPLGVAREFGSFLRQNSIETKRAAAILGMSTSALQHFLNTDRNLEEEYMKKICGFARIDESRFAPVNSIHGKNIILPANTSAELLQFVAYLSGDGCVHKRGLRFKDSRKEVLEIYASLARQLFNVESRTIKLPKANAYLLEINSKFLCSWIKENFSELCEKGMAKSVPVWIGKVPDAELRGFIRGLYDAEGCVNASSDQVTLRMANENFIRTTQMFLLRFNILSSFAKHGTQWGLSYSLSINNADSASNFSKFIGLSSTEKKEKLSFIISKMKAGLSYTYKPIPMTKKQIKEAYSVKNKSLNGNSYLTLMAVTKLVPALQQSYGFAAEQLSRFLQSDIVFQEVTEIRRFPADTEHVYDLEVTETENFIANGLISHNSRWATHGKVLERNAHPHLSMDSTIAIVHNGIVENFSGLKAKLISKGYTFRSDTDSEVIANLIQENTVHGMGFREAVRSALLEIEGSYAVVAMCTGNDTLVCGRNGSPLVIGIASNRHTSENEYFIASDATAFIEHTNNAVFLNDLEMAEVSTGGIKVSSVESGLELPYEKKELHWSFEQSRKGFFPHFMLKEIFEQPNTIALAGEQPHGDVERAVSMLKGAKKVFLAGCGSSYHACMVASYFFSKVAGMEVKPLLASEFHRELPFMDSHSLVIGVSQSGETADLIECIRSAKKAGAKIASIVNVMDSTVMRISDASLLMNAGPEICVLSTKSYTSQVAILLLLAYSTVGKEQEGRELIEVTSELALDVLSSNKELVKSLAKKFAGSKDIFVIGRGNAYPTALESALKIKEVSYIHAEGFAGGELKHGTLALVEEGTPAIAMSTPETRPLTLSNAIEMKSRGAYIIGVDSEENNAFDASIILPDAGDANPILMVLPIHLFSYYLAIERGCDPDKPRNLAKSCTVK